MNNSSGIELIAQRSGVSAQIPPVQTSSLKQQQVFNSWMKLRTPWNLPSNGQPKRVLCVMKTWEVLDSTSTMLPFTLMQSTEVLVKLCQQPEESSSPLNLLPVQSSKNQSSCVRSKLQMMQLDQSIKYSPKEEVSLLVKSQFVEHHLWTWKLIFQ